MYDIVVLGGGIAGLYTALHYSRKNYSVLLCEKYKAVGGRVDTFKHNGYRWESGAGRISKKHKLLLSLIKEYNLTLVPISSALAFKKDGYSCIEPNLFDETLEAIVSPLHSLTEEILSTHTLKELLVKVHGAALAESYLDRFPYRAETEVLRADLALHSFKNEMGTHDGYYVCAEGLSALIEKMKQDLYKEKCEIKTEYPCIDIVEYSDHLSVVFEKEVVQAKNIVCALNSEALKKIPYFKNLEVLKKVIMKPLLRTYAIYPKDPVWFAQLPSVVSSGPVRYFIPIDYKRGVAMISYTDSRDTEEYHKFKDDTTLGKRVQSDLKKLFGPIPDYKYFKSHYWKYGATYWLPGKYNPIKESNNSIKPFSSNVYIVGESFSLRQAWIEGALEQCEKLFALDIIV